MQRPIKNSALISMLALAVSSCSAAPRPPSGNITPMASNNCETTDKKWKTPEECIAPTEEQNAFIMTSEPHVIHPDTPKINASPCKDIPAKVDLSPHDTSIKTQYGGRCSSYGLIAAMENRAKQLGLRMNDTADIDLSETHLFWAQRFKYASTIALNTASKAPIMGETFWREENYSGLKRKLFHRLWGRPEGNFAQTEGLVLSRFTQIHQQNQGKFESIDQQQLCTALRALKDKKPLYMALSVNRSLARLDSPVEASGPETGGHAVAVVGYELKRNAPGSPLEGTFLIKNSWGKLKSGAVRKDGAADGYQNVPFSYCWTDGKYCGLWAIDSVTVEKVTRVFRP